MSFCEEKISWRRDLWLEAVKALSLILFTLLICAPSSALGATYYVSPSGNDSASGSLAFPFKTINFAVSKLSAGDILYIREGRYFEEVKVSVSGSAGSPIQIKGYPGETAIIDAGYPEFQIPGNDDWELVNAARGEYRSKRPCASERTYGYINGIPGYENERVALVPYKDADEFRAATEQYINSSDPFYVGPGTFIESGRCYIRLAKTQDLRNAEARYGQVLAAENADPRSYSIHISQASYALEVEGAYLAFADLTVMQAKRTVYLRSGAHHVTFDGVTVWNGDSAVETNSSSVHDIVIKNSRILGDAPVWIFWSDMKNDPRPADYMRSTSIDLRGGTYNWDISWNLIRGSGQDLIGVNNDEQGIVIHHNRIENCGDDAFELEGTSDIGRVEMYENYISNCLLAVAPGQDTANVTGPILFYRNIVSLLRDPPINRAQDINSWNGGGRFGFLYMFKHGEGSNYATRNVHYYHNTLVMLNAYRGINPTPKYPDDSTFANNLIVMVNDRMVRDYKTGSGQVIDGNLYWRMNPNESAHLLVTYDTVGELFNAAGLEQHSLGAVPKRGTDPKLASFALGIKNTSASRWAIDAASERKNPVDFFLGAGSPAIGAGVSIPLRQSVGVLPDSRTSLDIGAIPSGASPAEYQRFPFEDTTRDTVAPSSPKQLRVIDGA